jgi:hypothetical protein
MPENFLVQNQYWFFSMIGWDFFILVLGFPYRKGGILWQIFGHNFFYT